jgi:hypothetical protein
MKKVLGFVIGALLLVGASRAAHAGSGTGYVCDIEDPSGGGGSYGSYGYTWMSLTSGPSCTGTFVGSGYFCSTGATASVCAGSAGWLRSDSQLQGLVNRLTQAAIGGTKVYLTVDGNNNPLTVYYYAAGY